VRHFLYEYVPDILDRRGPHRDAHLALVHRWKDEGSIVLAGALGDPPHGAAFAFRVEDPSQIDQFTRDDPYVDAGLVTERRVEPWTVV
jgi:uncharacterized protein YciI